MSMLLGTPIDRIVASYVELGGLASTSLSAIVLTAIVIVPVAWLIYTEVRN